MNNKIIINKDNLKIDCEGVQYKNGKLLFLNSGDYVIEYVDSSRIHLDISILDCVLVKLFIFSKHNDVSVDNHYVLGENSQLLLFQFYDNLSVSEKVMIDLNGKNSKYYQAFSSVSHGCEEYHIIVNHNNSCVSSDIRSKCVGLDGSKIYLKVDSNLKKGNIDCVMDQNSRILTLGDVEAKIIPNMFIDEDSVEARHGSIIGSFDEEQVFYLMSRGISRDEAILLLIKGFLFSNMVVDLEKREYMMESILNIRR